MAIQQLIALLLSAVMTGCSAEAVPARQTPLPIEDTVMEELTVGTDTYRSFTLDNVLHSASEGDIHFNLYVPESYDGTEPYALFVTLPGYEGLYFQGVGANMQEPYGFEAQKYHAEMIIAAPQLSDWGMTSARQAVALTEDLMARYNIDASRVYLHGLSGGGETGSLVMELRPALFAGYLATSSQWDGELAPLVEAETPVYLATGIQDSYYGSASFRKTYEQLRRLYAEKGLSQDRIDQLVVLDLKEQAFFSGYGISDQHMGAVAFAYESEIMNWLFAQQGSLPRDGVS